jgi:hypothetical protein
VEIAAAIGTTIMTGSAALVGSMTVTAIMVETCMVESSAIEIGSVVSFKKGTVVLEVYAIPVVTGPCGIIIVGISRKIGFTDRGIGIIAVVVNGSGLGIYRRGPIDYRCGCDIDPGAGYAKADMGAYKYLRIAFGGDEARGDDGGKNG